MIKSSQEDEGDYMFIIFFTIPAWVFFLIMVLGYSVLPSAMGIIGWVIIIIVMIAILAFFVSLAGLIADISDGGSNETLGLLGTLFLSGLISLGGVSLIYDNTVRPYQVEKSDEKDFVLEDPNKEMEGLFNLPEIEWTDSVSAGGNDGTAMGSEYSNVWANYSEGGFVKVYAGKNYKYLAFSSYSSDEDYTIYADDKKINCEKILEDEKTKVYNLNNCETIKIDLKDDDTVLEDVYVYKTQYPTIIED